MGGGLAFVPHRMVMRSTDSHEPLRQGAAEGGERDGVDGRDRARERANLRRPGQPHQLGRVSTYLVDKS